jgi:hypothetical protein
MFRRFGKPCPSSAPPAARAEGVESANVVGYDTLTITNGYSLVTATFSKIGTTKFTLGDLKPTDFNSDNGDLVQFYSATGNGAIGQMAYYYPGDGWQDADGNSLDNYEITSGIGGIFYTASVGGAKFVVSGEVKMNGVTSSLAQGYTVTGNCLPISLKLADITPVNFNSDSGDLVQFYSTTGNGAIGQMAYYYPGDGWQDADGNSLADYEIKAGTSFIVYASNASASLGLPSITQN